MTGDTNKFIRASEAAIENAKQKMAAYQGPCADCKFRRGIDPYFWKCTNPIVRLAAFAETDLYTADLVRRCNHQRSNDFDLAPVVCGPSGTLFEYGRSFWGRVFRPDIEVTA